MKPGVTQRVQKNELLQHCSGISQTGIIVFRRRNTNGLRKTIINLKSSIKRIDEQSALKNRLKTSQQVQRETCPPLSRACPIVSQ